MPIWIPESAIRAFHAELLAEHSGAQGGIDENLLGVTLGRPQQMFTYADPTPSVFQLAAAYGYGFAKNHCFTDGNKRVALVAIDVFLQLNDYELVALEVEAAAVIIQLASNAMSETELATWLENNSIPLQGS